MGKKIIILASGGGTNAQNIIRYFDQDSEINVHSVLCNRKEAGVYERVKALGVHSQWFDANSEVFLLDYMEEHQPDLIVLAGYLKKIPNELVELYSNTIINIHPALLPKYGGKGMYGMHVHNAVFENKETETGITIHFVNKNYDEGAIIFQAKAKLDENDTPTSIASKIHKLEQQYFPRIIEQVILQINE